MRARAHLPLAFIILSCACSAETASPSPEGRLTVSVAAVELPQVTDACYDLEVRNDTNALVWSETAICASSYGARGDITFVGSCDATDGPDADALATNTVTLRVTSLTGATGPITDFINPCAAPLAPAGCVLSAPCVENADTPLTFNLTLMRQANQGFFDVAVNFADIFCSAKVDCVDGAGAPLALLHNPNTGARDQTAVVALACTAGPGQTDTLLLRDRLAVRCGGSLEFLDPTGHGNAYAPDDPETAGPIWQYATYAGSESLTCGGTTCDKKYWNIAIGFDPTTPDCVLTTAATAVDTNTFSSPAATIYPVIEYDVRLTQPTGGLACSRHPVNGTPTGTSTAYTSPALARNFERSFDGETFSAAPFGDGAGYTLLRQTDVAYSGAVTSNPYDLPAAFATDSAGRLVLGGYSKNPDNRLELVVWRLLSNGHLDPTFGGGRGFTVVNPGVDRPCVAFPDRMKSTDGGCSDILSDLQVDAAGRIVVLGYSSYTATVPVGGVDQSVYFAKPYVIRFTAAGALDATLTGTFADGTPTLGFRLLGPAVGGASGRLTEVADNAYRLSIDTSGRYVIVGRSRNTNGPLTNTSTGSDTIVWRLLPTGAPDPTWHGGGVWQLHPGGTGLAGRLTGTGLANASRLESFGNLQILGDGRYLLSGWSATSSAGTQLKAYLIALDPITGEFDPSFTGSPVSPEPGIVGLREADTQSLAGAAVPYDIITSIEPYGSSGFIAVGYSTTPFNPSVPWIARFNGKGEFDPTFANGKGYRLLFDGTYTTSEAFGTAHHIYVFGTTWDAARKRIYVSGRGRGTLNQYDLWVGALDPDGAWDPTFGIGGFAVFRKNLGCMFTCTDLSSRIDNAVRKPIVGADGTLTVVAYTTGRADATDTSYSPLIIRHTLDGLLDKPAVAPTTLKLSKPRTSRAGLLTTRCESRDIVATTSAPATDGVATATAPTTITLSSSIAGTTFFEGDGCVGSAATTALQFAAGAPLKARVSFTIPTPGTVTLTATLSEGATTFSTTETQGVGLYGEGPSLHLEAATAKDGFTPQTSNCATSAGKAAAATWWDLIAGANNTTVIDYIDTMCSVDATLPWRGDGSPTSPFAFHLTGLFGNPYSGKPNIRLGTGYSPKNAPAYGAMLWVQVEALPPTTPVTAILMNYYQHRALGMSQSGNLMASHFYELQSGPNPTTQPYYVSTPLKVTPGLWHHMAITETKDNTTIWLDGTPYTLAHSGAQNVLADEWLRFGIHEYGADFGGSVIQALRGSLGGIKLYKRVLDETEVKADFEATRATYGR